MDYEQLPEKYRPLSPWAYWGWSILYTIPVIGFIFLIVNSFRDSNINRRNFTRSYWCGLLLALIIVVILAATGTLTAILSDLTGAF